MLTEKRKSAIRRINRKNEYCLTPDIVEDMNKRHQETRNRNDMNTMEAIEYRLTDINFHTECGLMMQGEYEKVENLIREWRNEG